MWIKAPYQVVDCVDHGERAAAVGRSMYWIALRCCRKSDDGMLIDEDLFFGLCRRFVVFV